VWVFPPEEPEEPDPELELFEDDPPEEPFEPALVPFAPPLAVVEVPFACVPFPCATASPVAAAPASVAPDIVDRNVRRFM